MMNREETMSQSTVTSNEWKEIQGRRDALALRMKSISLVFPVAEWVDEDEWGDFHCTNCREFGDREDRFCSNCGSFMKNFASRLRYHYFCKHCGANLDDSPYTVNSDVGVEAKEFIYTCPDCGRKTTLSFEDGIPTIEDNQKTNEVLSRMERLVASLTSERAE